MAVIADASKLVQRLGAFPLPVEVVPFGLAATRRHIRTAMEGLGLSGDLVLRGGASPFVTDGGHFILDCRLGAIPEPERLAAALSAIPGVVEHGLFIGYARAAFVAGSDGVRDGTAGSDFASRSFIHVRHANSLRTHPRGRPPRGAGGLRGRRGVRSRSRRPPLRPPSPRRRRRRR